MGKQKVFGMCSPIAEHPLMTKVKAICTKKNPCLNNSKADPLPLTCETFLGGFGMEHGPDGTMWKHNPNKKDGIMDQTKLEGQEWVKKIAKGQAEAVPSGLKHALAYTCARVFVSNLYDPTEDVDTGNETTGEYRHRFGTAYQVVTGMVVECHSTTETASAHPKMTCTDSTSTKSCYETTYETAKRKFNSTTNKPAAADFAEEESTIRANLFAKGVILPDEEDPGLLLGSSNSSNSSKPSKWKQCAPVNKMKLTSAV